MSPSKIPPAAAGSVPHGHPTANRSLANVRLSAVPGWIETIEGVAAAQAADPAMARRIVAALNACAGISTAELERIAAAGPGQNPLDGLTTLLVTTRHPTDYVLINEVEQSLWRGTPEGKWVRDEDKMSAAA
ncbi:MAG: hypothetical protein NDI66_06425 [Pseudomonas sp.]|nr:hypothetical protein [Pseudomonas sp.]